jgi:hypothetical protein
MGKKFTTRERVQRAEKAWDALWLGIVTQADRQRAIQVLDGLRALDYSRSNLAAEVERLVELYRKSTPPFDGGAQILFRLCKELEQLYIHEKKAANDGSREEERDRVLHPPEAPCVRRRPASDLCDGRGLQSVRDLLTQGLLGLLWCCADGHQRAESEDVVVD